MSKIKSVLFVCTGNSCRSVMAEGLLKKYLKEQGRNDIDVKSAGVCAIDDMKPTVETVEIMRKAGVDVSAFKSRCLTDELINKSDLILVMAAHHMDDIIKRVPGAAPKVHMLKACGLDTDTGTYDELDIPDPIGHPIGYYKFVLEIIEKEIKRISKLL